MRSHSSSAPTPSFEMRARHDAVADRVDARPLLDAYVDAAVESLSAVAAHLAEAAGDSRVDRKTAPPATRAAPEPNASASNCGRMAGDVGGCSRSCEVATTTRTSAFAASATTRWPGRSSATPEGLRNCAIPPAPSRNPSPAPASVRIAAVAANRDDAPALVGHVQLAIGSDGNAERTEEPVAVRPRRRGHASVLVHGADDAVSGVGDIDIPRASMAIPVGVSKLALSATPSSAPGCPDPASVADRAVRHRSPGCDRCRCLR